MEEMKLTNTPEQPPLTPDASPEEIAKYAVNKIYDRRFKNDPYRHCYGHKYCYLYHFHSLFVSKHHHEFCTYCFHRYSPFCYIFKSAGAIVITISTISKSPNGYDKVSN